MDWPPLAPLVLFMGAVLVVAAFIVAVSGHFPAEHRKPALAGPAGTAIIVATSLVVAGSGLLALHLAWRDLPWYAAVLGAGPMILAGPYMLHPLPDRVVNGASILLLLAGLAGVLAGLMLTV